MLLAGTSFAISSAAEESKTKRKFTLCLSCGLLGLPTDPHKLLPLATQFGFETVEPPTSFLAKLSDAELQAYLQELNSRKLTWGAAGLPVDFRSSEQTFNDGMKSLPDYAKGLERAGVTRVATWLLPGSSSLTYLANFHTHTIRLRQVAQVLGDRGVRFGLEYVGPKTSWSANRFPFVHTMKEMKELIAEIGRENVGFLLDSWHWYTAQETEDDLLSLRASDVVMCHLNDAPKGVPVAQQVDGHRELPCTTGIIDPKLFLGAMIKIGYDGPVACEPFKPELRKMPEEQALALVAAAIKEAAAEAETA